MASYYHVPFEDNKLDEAVEKAVGNSPLKEYLHTEEEEEEKRGVFGAIHDLMDAAFDMYCYNELGWDKMCEELSKAITNLKGKEEEFKNKLKEDEKEDEEENEEAE